MQIFTVVIATLLLVGLILSLLFNVTILSFLQKQSNELSSIKTLTNKYMQDQQQIGNLFVQFIVTLNNFTAAIDDFTLTQDGQLPISNDSGFLGTRPVLGDQYKLSDDDIKRLTELLSEDISEEDPSDDEETTQ